MKADAHGRDANSTAKDWDVVTPNDNQDLPQVARMIQVGEAGAVTVINGEGKEVVIPAAIAGQSIPGWVKRIKAAGTDSTWFIAYYR